jgi:hypothetical protein
MLVNGILEIVMDFGKGGLIFGLRWGGEGDLIVKEKHFSEIYYWDFCLY